MPKRSETAKATDIAGTEPLDLSSSIDPTITHHLPQLLETAKAENAVQKKVLAAGTLAEGEGERVLTVKPDGSYGVKFVPAGK